MASGRKFSVLSVNADSATIERVQSELREVKNGSDRAIVGAINKTLPQGRKVIVDRLWQTLAIKKRKNILDRTEVVLAKFARPAGTIRLLGRRIGLINFSARDTRNKRTGTGQGVIAQAYRSGKPERYPDAFIGVGLNNNRHVFERGRGYKVVEDAHHLPNIGRYMQRLMSLRGLSLVDVYREHPEMEAEAMEKTGSIFETHLLSQVDRLLQRRRSARTD